jgi:hypothetical protein
LSLEFPWQVVFVISSPFSSFFLLHICLCFAQVPELRDHLTDATNWAAEADRCLRDALNLSDSDPERRRRELASLARTYNIDNYDEVLDDPVCGVCAQIAAQRCSRCKHAWYCGRACQVADWNKHKPMCEVLMQTAQMAAAATTPAAATNASSSSSPSASTVNSAAEGQPPTAKLSIRASPAVTAVAGQASRYLVDDDAPASQAQPASAASASSSSNASASAPRRKVAIEEIDE